MPTKVEKDAYTGQETTGHEWDGIKELNTPLPRWWLYVFYASIAIAFLYFVLYPAIPYGAGYTEGLLGRQQRVILEQQLAAAEARQQQEFAGIDKASLEDIVADPKLLTLALAGGRAAFNENCAACHALGGAGQGHYPVLADDKWLWGGTLDEIRTTIVHGIRWDEDDDTRYSEMPPYGDILDKAQRREVAEYVLSLTGRADDEAAVEAGQAVFEENCAACHGEKGGGDPAVGAPALDDEIWLYGGSLADVEAQIASPQHGVMPAWGKRLGADTIKMLTVYVHSLGGGQ